MVVSDAEGIGTASGFRARIYAKLLVSVLNVRADLVVAAVCGVLTGSNGGAARNDIIGIVSFESLGTETLANIADSIGATLGIEAEVLSILTTTLRHTLLERISVKSELTSAVKAAFSVDTSGISSAHISTQTLVHIQTLLECNSIVALLACAVRSPSGHGAEGVVPAGEAVTGQLLLMLLVLRL